MKVTKIDHVAILVEDLEKVSGRIVYSQELLKEYGMIKP